MYEGTGVIKTSDELIDLNDIEQWQLPTNTGA